MIDNIHTEYFEKMFKDYPDVVTVKELKQMIPYLGKNKLYQLLKDKKIYSKKIGRDYIIPKLSIIKYLLDE